MVVMAHMCTSGVRDRRGRRGSSEQSVSPARVPASTSESSEAHTETSGPAEGPCIAAAVPDDAAAGLPAQTEHAQEAGERQHAQLHLIMAEVLA